MNFGANLINYIYIFIAILLSLTIHELSHAYVSYKLGDPTAKQMGRLTLNPLKHLDPLGTIMLIISSLSGYGLGWAKPVPINPMYYRNKRRGTILVSVAGPLSNFLLTIIFATIYFIVGVYAKRSVSNFDMSYVLYIFSFYMIQINIGLAAFNLLPFPPLDGSKILGGFLPPKIYYDMVSVENYVSFVFLFIILAKPSILNIFLSPIINGLLTLVNIIAKPIANLFI